jgi:hypothetical protein
MHQEAAALDQDAATLLAGLSMAVARSLHMVGCSLQATALAAQQPEGTVWQTLGDGLWDFWRFETSPDVILDSCSSAARWMGLQLQALQVSCAGDSASNSSSTNAKDSSGSMYSLHSRVMRRLQQQQEKLLQCLQAAQQAVSSGSGQLHPMQVLLQQTQLPQLLQDYSVDVCSQLPLRICCNSVRYVNTNRPSEAQLVAGRGCRCSAYRSCFFCCRECQVMAWKEGHKAVCKRLAALATASSEMTQILG